MDIDAVAAARHGHGFALVVDCGFVCFGKPLVDD